MSVGRRALALGAGWLLAVAGCTGSGAGKASRVADPTVVLRSANEPGATVRYDRTSGTCSSGVQLVDADRFDDLTEGWQLDGACTGPRKATVPDTAAYPALFAQRQLEGSAQVLVRLQADGGVESVQAVCATDSAFAATAAEVARAITYEPATCGGKPVRNAFLVPFAYEFR